MILIVGDAIARCKIVSNAGLNPPRARPTSLLNNQYLDSKLESHLKLDWYNEQAVKSEARRQANQPVRQK